MRKKLFSRAAFIAALWISVVTVAQNAGPQPETNSPPPLIRAHAHNDYEHARPLLDALDRGFCSIEADVWLVDGRLLVAHDRNAVKAERTLQALYLDPLRERVRRNGGRVYRNGPEVTLLVDVKSDAEKTYVVLREVLKEYSAMLAACRGAIMQTNAITVIVSGNRAPKTMAGESLRYAFLDGRIEDLERHEANTFIPLISDNWSKVFQWRWEGPIPDDERAKLIRIVGKAHSQGRKVRFWATPDRPDVWKTLLDAGVDLINTDQLDGLQKFLLSRSANQ